MPYSVLQKFLTTCHKPPTPKNIGPWRQSSIGIYSSLYQESEANFSKCLVFGTKNDSKFWLHPALYNIILIDNNREESKGVRSILIFNHKVIHALKSVDFKAELMVIVYTLPTILWKLKFSSFEWGNDRRPIKYPIISQRIKHSFDLIRSQLNLCALLRDNFFSSEKLF